MSRKNIIALGIGGIMILCIIIWVGIWQKLAAGFSPTPTSTPTSAYTAPVLTPEVPALAGTVLVGTKVSTKFYLARTGYRYVFPDETKTLETWFPVNPPIKKIAQDELEKYPLGGNVWYKPGTRLIHISTDPKIYAVAHGGVLRALASEDLAAQIFGTNWKKLLDLMPDYYFTNYKIGAPINSINDYSIATEQNAAQTIEMNLGL